MVKTVSIMKHCFQKGYILNEQSSKEQHLLQIDNIYNIINIFDVPF